MARTTVRYRINGGPLQRRNCITDKGTDAEILTLLAATHGCSEKEVEVQKPKASPAQSKSSPPPAGKEAASGKDAAGSGQTAKK